MPNFDWCVLGSQDPPEPLAKADIWHMVAFTEEVGTSRTTVCGLPVANPDEEWRWADKLGNHRSCDNCTHVLAHKADAEPSGSALT
jgi:hypothetical protein